jgi:hypothetical protein
MRTIKRILLTSLLCITLSQVFGQTGKLYRGTINRSIKITLYLEDLDKGTNADQIMGSYKYDNKNAYLLLNGYRNNVGNVVLVEQGSANFSGVFLGTFKDKSFNGRWLSADVKKSYSFELVEAAASSTQVKKFSEAIETKAGQFRSY